MSKVKKSFTLVFYAVFFRAIVRLGLIFVLHFIVLTLLGIVFFVVENQPSIHKNRLRCIYTMDTAASNLYQPKPNDINLSEERPELASVHGTKKQADNGPDINQVTECPVSTEKREILHLPLDSNKCAINTKNGSKKENEASTDEVGVGGKLNSIYINLLAATLGLGKYYPCTFWGKIIILFSGLIGIITLGIIAGIAFRAVQVAYQETKL